MKPTDFAARLTGFLGEYLPSQKNVSPNTIKAYRDAFTLLLRYCRDNQKIPLEKVTLDTLNASLVLSFLEKLESEGNCGTRTRNHRLSVLHAFFRYLQTEAPERMVQCQQILAIPFQRCSRPIVNYLSTGELAEILAQPDLATDRGRRDAVMLSLLYGNTVDSFATSFEDHPLLPAVRSDEDEVSYKGSAIGGSPFCPCKHGHPTRSGGSPFSG